MPSSTSPADMSLILFLSLCLAANLWAFMAMGFDKVAAVRNQRRISEGSLLGLTLIGGIGTIAASTLFKHKTRKQPFRRYAEVIAGLHVFLVAFFITLLV